MQRTESGVRLHFDAGPGVEAELQRLVEAERQCCGDAGITWDLLDHGEHLVVEVRAPGELHNTIAQLFSR